MNINGRVGALKFGISGVLKFRKPEWASHFQASSFPY